MGKRNRDLIVVHAMREDDVEAASVELLVDIHGSSFWTGDEAFTKAEEVRAFVAALRAVGLKDGDIKIEDINVLTKSGVFARSSAANYRLRVRCAAISSLPEVVGVVSAQKNVFLEGLDWRYDNTNEVEARLLAECARDTRSKADAIARAIGARVSGVCRFSEEVSQPTVTYGPQAALRSRAVARGGATDLGFQISHKKRVIARTKAVIRIDPNE